MQGLSDRVNTLRDRKAVTGATRMQKTAAAARRAINRREQR
jgi:hypothetical protein